MRGIDEQARTGKESIMSHTVNEQNTNTDRESKEQIPSK